MQEQDSKISNLKSKVNETVDVLEKQRQTSTKQEQHAQQQHQQALQQHQETESRYLSEISELKQQIKLKEMEQGVNMNKSEIVRREWEQDR